MTRFSLALAVLLAPAALAFPKAQGYGYVYESSSEMTEKPTVIPTGAPFPHPSGGSLGPIGSSSAPFGFGNSTSINGPTGTGSPVGTGSSSVPLSTVTVVPIPEASPVDSNIAAAPGQPSATGNSPIGGSSGAEECGPATVTVTSANTVTVTMGAGSISSAEESSPISPSSASSAPYPIGNETTAGPTGTVGTVSILPIETSSEPSTAAALELPTGASSELPIETSPELSVPVYTGLPATTASAVVSTDIVAPTVGSSSSVKAHGYHHVSLHKSRSSSPKIDAEIPTSTPSAAAGEFDSVLAPTSAPAPTTPASTSPSATSTATSSPSGSGGNVVPRGLVYNTASLTTLFEKDTIGWCYNWDSQTGGDIPSGMNFVPMLWSDSDLHVPRWEENAKSAISNGATHILGFNEPDLAEQANMTPDDAARAWEHMEKFAGQVKIGSPAVCNGGGEVGLSWLKKFMSACSSCTVDFIAIHWYGDANDFGIEALKQFIKDTQEMADGRPIWITEFQPKGSIEQQAAFMDEILPYLDDQSNGVERYAYFQVDNILASGSALSELGSKYLS